MSFTTTIPMPYAVAYERWDSGATQADIQYVQATSIPEAKILFLQRCMHITLLVQRRLARIVEIAPALGYRVEDRDGKVLSV